ncbi:MAG: hypothetical protein QOD98_4295 [Nocardioidaceae bacterium]|jgi:hypothetical protein|nr:hypothetical protein [Nocardioidaceae bacterium]
MKLGLALVGVLLVVPGLVSCGGDDSSGGKAVGDQSVSVEEFCAAAEKFENTFSAIDATDLAAGVATFKNAAQELKDTGTPDDITDAAREGLELTLDKIIGLPDDAGKDDIGAVLQFTSDEKAKSMAFEAYLDDTCKYRNGGGG